MFLIGILKNPERRIRHNKKMKANQEKNVEIMNNIIYKERFILKEYGRGF